MGSQKVLILVLISVGLPIFLILLWVYNIIPYEMIIGIVTFGMLGLIVYAVKYIFPVGQDSSDLYSQIAVRSEYGEHDRAIKFFSQLIEKHKKDKMALQNLSAAYIFKGDYDKAIEICNRLLELKPNHRGALRILAIAFSHKGRYDEAIEIFTQVVHEEPRNYYLWKVFAEIHMRKGDLNKALEYVDKALELKFNFKEALKLREDIKSKLNNNTEVPL